MNVFTLGKQNMLDMEMYLPDFLHWRPYCPAICSDPPLFLQGLLQVPKAALLKGLTGQDGDIQAYTFGLMWVNSDGQYLLRGPPRVWPRLDYACITDFSLHPTQLPPSSFLPPSMPNSVSASAFGQPNMQHKARLFLC